MAATPKTTTWALEPHTRAKHEILRRYLAAWVPILARSREAVAYVDGFAGPGVYSGGEDGSPIIALKSALQHAGSINSKVLFLFVEKDAERAEVLKSRVNEIERPANFRVKVAAETTFEQGIRENLIDFFRREGKVLPPTFAFIDPFGWTGVPFGLVKQILNCPSCEVLVNFMFEEINRFIGHPEQCSNFDELFGTGEWREAVPMSGPAQRKAFLHGLYLRQLRQTAGAKYVRSFEMRNDRDVTDYFLFFATNSPTGMARMKEAMWKVDETGEFRFSDATNPEQALLFTPQPDFAALRRAVVGKFGGTVTTVAEIEKYVLAETPYRETHYKRQVLAELEREGRLAPVEPSPRRRPGTYGDAGMRLRFTS